MKKTYKAALLIIGNEILSGKVADQNLQFLAIELNEIGIRLTEVRVVLDIEQAIINAVLELHQNYDYVFTTGGIGATHDDITTKSIAKAFNRKLIINEKALEAVKNLYSNEDFDMPNNLNKARLRMAYIPENARLITNKITKVPGFAIENVYVMAGIPKIMHSMFESVKHELIGGKSMKSTKLRTKLKEEIFAIELTEIQNIYRDVEIGSYPITEENIHGTDIIISSTNLDKIEEAKNAVKEMLMKNEKSQRN